MPVFSRHKRLFILGILALGTIVIWIAVWESSRDTLTLSVLDVGQGDAIYIRHGNEDVLIDGSKDRSVLRGLGRAMPFWDRSIDVILATHPDADHIGGLPDVLTRYTVGTVIESGNTSDTAVYKEFEQDIQKEGARHVVGTRGTIVRLGDDAYMEILFPDRSQSEVVQWESNMSSLVIRLVHGDSVAILTGDAPIDSENYVVGMYGAGLHADVLKTGHHGSKTSTSDAFLAAVAPKYVAISVGCDNTYGHPSPSVVEKIRAFGATIGNTCEDGTLVYESEGKGFVRR
ncbi:MAG: MBL fold metallo-hydrolase [Candidatus Yonathbacteria bacterium]|nr:MBL fold metallo-hydrolase [Candidatus Yonathbacteria bacterium]